MSCLGNWNRYVRCSQPKGVLLTSFKLREEKIDLENALEAESESHVNKMARELTVLRQAQNGGTSNSSLSASPETGLGFRSFMLGGNIGDPSAETMLEAMRRENEQLRGKLVDTERDYVRISRLNEIYREELIDHRRRVCYLLITNYVATLSN